MESPGKALLTPRMRPHDDDDDEITTVKDLES